MPGWISTRKALPEPGKYVLIRHNFRLSEYESPYGIGVRVPRKNRDASMASWMWTALKSPAYMIPPSDGHMEYCLSAHCVCPGDNYVTHWMEIPEPNIGGIADGEA